MNFDDPRFGGISAMEIDSGGRTITLLTDRGHRLLHYPASFAPLRAAPRLLLTPTGLKRARSNRGIEAATETADKKILLIAEDLATSRAFTFA
ncbi:MAG: hypothetical protein ACPGQM_06150 [Alphaproteobacteria bacterium]